MAVDGASAARPFEAAQRAPARRRRGRLAVFTTHPIQYQCPLWRKLQEACDLEVRVFFLSDFSARTYHDREFGKQVAWSTPLLEGYEHEAFRHDQIRSLAAAGPPWLLRRLRRFAPDACLINGYVPLYYWHAVVAARWLRVPVLLRTEATDDDRRRASWWGALRTAALRGLYAGVSRFLAIGVNARRHYERLGVPASRIGFAPYCTDTDFFEAQRREAVRGPLRRRLGIPDDACGVLFCGKLIAKKDPQLLVEALAGLPDVRGRPVHAIFMGDGELRGQLEDAARRACPGRVHFLGYKPQHEMGEVYANGDMIVLPSRWSETWGLVVNEALQFGLPAIVSDRVGCGPDLIHEGDTGFVFPAGRADELRQRIAALAARIQDDRAALAERCRALVDRYSLHNAARGIDEAFRAVRDAGR